MTKRRGTTKFKPPKAARERAKVAKSTPLRIGVLELITVASVVFLLVALLWPKGHGMSDPLRRADCYHRMQHVVAATLHYALTHDGTYPADLKSCPEVRALASRDLICPGSNLESNPPQAALAGAALDASEPVSYMYVGNGVTTTASSDIVIWLEDIGNHQSFGFNVACADGHIEWIDLSVADEVMNQARQGIRPVKLPSDFPTTQP